MSDELPAERLPRDQQMGDLFELLRRGNAGSVTRLAIEAGDVLWIISETPDNTLIMDEEVNEGLIRSNEEQEDQAEETEGEETDIEEQDEEMSRGLFYELDSSSEEVEELMVDQDTGELVPVRKVTAAKMRLWKRRTAQMERNESRIEQMREDYYDWDRWHSSPAIQYEVTEDNTDDEDYENNSDDELE
jgi:hypothetical protein